MPAKLVTSLTKRIDAVDALRGFALAGILYAHMIIWHTGAALPDDVYLKYDSIPDGIAMAIFGTFVLGKFFSVFSFLFGLSFYLHLSHNIQKSHFIWLYLWRLIILFFIGMIHHIVWRGDILAIYAVLGILLLLFRHLSSTLILVASIILILNLPVHLYDAFQQDSYDDNSVSFPMQEEAEHYYLTVQQGSLSNVLQDNWNSWPSKIKYQMESGRLFMTFGYFLLGLLAGSLGFFSRIKQHLKDFKTWNRYIGIAILIQLCIGFWWLIRGYVTLPQINVSYDIKWFASFLFSIYNASVTLFYITGITILFYDDNWRSHLKPLTAIGRMALTNYLLQTFFGLLLFYQFGLGWFDKTSPALNVILAIVVFTIQLLFSRWWLSKFRQGPVEWLWRSLNYFEVQQLKKDYKPKPLLSDVSRSR